MNAATRAVIEQLVEALEMTGKDGKFGWFQDAAIAEARKLLEDDGWIRVEDAIPENRKAKIVWCPSNKCQFMACLDDGVWHAWHDGYQSGPMTTEVTQWRELGADPQRQEQQPDKGNSGE